MAEHNELGKTGEDYAVDYLVSKGYRILHRNWRCRHLELDIVAHDGTMLVLVEVKTRTNSQSPSDIMSYKKMRNVVNAAEGYIKYSGYQGEARIDLLVLTRAAQGFDIQHIPSAFR